MIVCLFYNMNINEFLLKRKSIIPPHKSEVTARPADPHLISPLFPGYRCLHVRLHGLRLSLPDGVRPGQHRDGRHCRHREEEELRPDQPAAGRQGARAGYGGRHQTTEKLSSHAGPCSQPGAGTQGRLRGRENITPNPAHMSGFLTSLHTGIVKKMADINFPLPIHPELREKSNSHPNSQHTSCSSGSACQFFKGFFDVGYYNITIYYII